MFSKHGGSTSGTASEADYELFMRDHKQGKTAQAMESNAESLVYQDSFNHVEEWERIKVVLQANPLLMTPRILHLALRNTPPLHVIEFLLSVNVRAASLPKRGPTALQCAVRYHASIDVIKCLLKACPFALLASNLDDTAFKDPLECARATRADEADLIEVLSKPLSFWLKESRKGTRFNDEGTGDSYSFRDSSDKADIDSVDVIAATITQSQEPRKQPLEVQRCDAKTWTAELLLEMDQEHQVVGMGDKNPGMGYRISNASDDAYANRSDIDARKDVALMKLEASADEFDCLVKDWKSKTERRIRRLEFKMKQESVMNEFHRKDTRLQLDCMEQTVHKPHSGDPLIFSTMFLSSMARDVDESEQPLFRKHPKLSSGRTGFWSSTKRLVRSSTRMRNN